MEKVVRIEAAGDFIEVTQEELCSNYWETTQVTLPKTPVTECNGIWDDDASFEVSEDHSVDKYALRIPITVLISLITHTRKIVEENDSWWRNQEDLRDRLVSALGIKKETAEVKSESRKRKSRK
jgi:hypothetical protein